MKSNIKNTKGPKKAGPPPAPKPKRQMETKKIEFDKISKNKDVIELLKQREELENEIFSKDEFALIKFECAKLGWEDEKTNPQQQTIERLREYVEELLTIKKSELKYSTTNTKRDDDVLKSEISEIEQLLNTTEQ